MLRLTAFSAAAVVLMPAALGAGVALALVLSSLVFVLGGVASGELTGFEALELLGDCWTVARGAF